MPSSCAGMGALLSGTGLYQAQNVAVQVAGVVLGRSGGLTMLAGFITLAYLSARDNGLIR